MNSQPLETMLGQRRLLKGTAMVGPSPGLEVTVVRSPALLAWSTSYAPPALITHKNEQDLEVMRMRDLASIGIGHSAATPVMGSDNVGSARECASSGSKSFLYCVGSALWCVWLDVDCGRRARYWLLAVSPPTEQALPSPRA
uniref:Uncharacterized protein n=1 Tax=Echinococcus granulosus TaxID=6210 RepID=A0A068WXY5_ECHGR|nr:hypothetical protein EgrG_002038400 [Echinococcus granulosus]